MEATVQRIAKAILEGEIVLITRKEQKILGEPCTIAYYKVGKWARVACVIPDKTMTISWFYTRKAKAGIPIQTDAWSIVPEWLLK